MSSMLLLRIVFGADTPLRWVTDGRRTTHPTHCAGQFHATVQWSSAPDVSGVGPARLPGERSSRSGDAWRNDGRG